MYIKSDNVRPFFFEFLLDPVKNYLIVCLIMCTNELAFRRILDFFTKFQKETRESNGGRGLLLSNDCVQLPLFWCSKQSLCCSLRSLILCMCCQTAELRPTPNARISCPCPAAPTTPPRGRANTTQ